MTAEFEAQYLPERLPRRLRVEVPAGFAERGGPRRVGRVVNLSRRGAFLATATPLPVGTSIGVLLTLPLAAGPRRVGMRGEVRWVNAAVRPCAPALPPGIGVEFRPLAPVVWEALAVCLLEQLANSARAASRAPAPARSVTHGRSRR
jgi:hypothetical protein